VKPDSTGDVPTISVAVDSAAAHGDTVLLGNGTFTGEDNLNVDCLDKALVVISKSGDPDLCTIDCGFTYPGETNTALHFRASEHGVPRLEGITIAHGCRGVICHEASAPVIFNCIFQDNHCYGAEIGFTGGGILCDTGSSPLIIDCTFLHNLGDAGGGVYCRESSPTIINATFSDNSAGLGGGVGTSGGSPRIIDCSFSNNYAGNPFIGSGGGAVYCGGSAELINCIFEENTCYGPGGALYYEPGHDSDALTLTDCGLIRNRALVSNVENWGGAIAAGFRYEGPGGNLVITNCTFSGNSIEDPFCGSALAISAPIEAVLENTVIALGEGEGAICCLWGASTPTIECCDIYGNAGGDWVGCIAGLNGTKGNFSADPKFCDTPSGYFWVEECSPCLPGNHPDGYDCGGVIGAFGAGCECSSGTEPTTWGAIKSMYR
jgi:hypothetical protein